MKELAVYFKKRMKDQDTIPRLWADRNYGEYVEYNVDHEIENRKAKLVGILNSLEKTQISRPNNDNFTFKFEKSSLKSFENEELKSSNTDSKLKYVEYELKLLKAYNFQKKLRRDVVLNFVNEFDKHNTVYYSDVLFHKTLLDRRFYKRQAPNVLAKKENRLTDKFEQQLRIGIDFRKRDKHIEFLNSLIQHHKEFMEFHKAKKVNFLLLFFIQLKNVIKKLHIFFSSFNSMFCNFQINNS